MDTGAFAHLGLRDSRRYLLLREVGGSLIQEAHELAHAGQLEMLTIPEVLGGQ